MTLLNGHRIVVLAGQVDERLQQQIAFIIELDRLKGIVRRSLLVDRSRYENTAEHSWHLAMLAMVLGERAVRGSGDPDREVRLCS